MSPGGRRRGKGTSRDDIIRAAREAFAEEGYDGTSLRAVARAAGVDAALVHHYFEGKAGLFMAAMALPFDALEDRLPGDPGGAPPPLSGAAVVAGFLTMWDRAEGTGSSFVACMGAMAASTAAAEFMREFVRARVWPHIAPVQGPSEHSTDARGALVASQLMGLAFTRYVLEMPPISTATPAAIGRWVGPTLERYGALDPE